MDLLEQVDWNSLECLNASPEHSVNNALKQVQAPALNICLDQYKQMEQQRKGRDAGYREDDGLYLESDTDEQILLHIPFQTAVKLHSIKIKSIRAAENAPKQIRLFINKPTLGFSDAADLACAQEFELTESQLQGEAIPLKLVKFQRVNVLTIFFASNHGDKETTIVQQVSLLGIGGETFNVNDIKKVGEGEQ